MELTPCAIMGSSSIAISNRHPSTQSTNQDPGGGQKVSSIRKSSIENAISTRPPTLK